MPKIGFPMPTDKNRFQILNLHPKIHAFKKNMVLKDKITKKKTITYLDISRILLCRITVISLFSADPFQSVAIACTLTVQVTETSKLLYRISEWRSLHRMERFYCLISFHFGCLIIRNWLVARS